MMPVRIFAVLLIYASFVEADRVYRSIDGSGNNALNPTWGQYNAPYIYTQGPKTYVNPATGDIDTSLPNPRNISNVLFSLPAVHTNKLTTNALVNWGQFVVHGIMLSGSSSTSMNIPVPAGDDLFGPEGITEIPFKRSIFDTSSGTYQILNAQTAYLDGSIIYGATTDRCNLVRTFVDGKLKTMAGNNNDQLLPLNIGLSAMAPYPDANRFFAGDIRANENPVLQSFHTLFVREHNRKAAELKAAGVSTDDEVLFQEARVWVYALIQHITFDEYLPHRLGVPLPQYNGYNSSVNAQIDINYMCGPMRYGHSAINTVIYRVDEDRNVIPEGHLLVRDVIFDPNPIKLQGIEPILRGLTIAPESAVDTRMVPDLRNFWFGSPHPPFDLAAVNVQRGRDHGAPHYNDARVALGLSRIQSWDAFPTTPAVRAALQNLYGTVDRVETWVGGLAELPVGVSTMGPMFTASLTEQFLRMRDGDRFWYENVGVMRSADDVAAIKKARLSDVVLWNTNIKGMPNNMMRIGQSLAPASASSSNGDCLSSTVAGFDCMATLSTDATLHWSIQNGGNAVSFGLYVVGATGWVGLGFSDGGMIGSDAVIGTDTEVVPYKLNDKIPSAVVKATGVTITGASLTRTAGNTLMQFTRTLSNGGTHVLQATGANTMVFAYGSSNTIGYHGSTRGIIQWSASGATTQQQHDIYKIIHAVLMSSSWGVLLPLGMFSARFLKDKEPTQGPAAYWFVVHITCQLTGISAAFSGWVLALTKFQNGPGSTTHGVLGMITMAMGLAQVLNGLARPHKGTKVRPAWEMLHHFLGRAALLLAMPTIFLGLERIQIYVGAGVQTWGAITYAIILVALGITFIVNTVLLKTKLSSSSSTSLTTKSVSLPSKNAISPSTDFGTNKVAPFATTDPTP